MEARDDDRLKHFVARAQQKKVLAAVPEGRVYQAVPTQLTVVVNEGRVTSTSDEVDATRFRYMGTSAPVSRYENMCGKRTNYDCQRAAYWP